VHPGLLFIFTYSTHAIDKPFNRSKHRVKERALTFEDTMHEAANGLCDHDDDREENQYLQNSYESHVDTSEFLRSQQRVDQVNKQDGREETGDSVFHLLLLKPF
jgi:hypothetical protein